MTYCSIMFFNNNIAVEQYEEIRELMDTGVINN